MKLYEFTCLTNEDDSKIVRVSGRISNHSDPAQQTEHITFQLSVDVPTVRNGALLRSEALKLVSDIARDIDVHFGSLVGER